MGLQPLILFSDHLFSFFAHLPVEPKFFWLATSPIILEHQWDPPFLQALPLCYIKNYGNCPPLKVCGNLFVQGSLGVGFCRRQAAQAGAGAEKASAELGNSLLVAVSSLWHRYFAWLGLAWCNG